MKIMLLGASGLTGSAVVPALMKQAEVEEVITPVRELRPAPDYGGRLRQVTMDFEDMASQQALFAVDGVACCLGTTRKRAGSKQAFRRVDLDYVVEAGRLAKAAGARCFSVISAQGADPDSAIFYSRTKGEMERALENLDFEHLAIFRPGLLIGDREEHRPAEAMFSRIAPIVDRALIGPLERYRSTNADQLGAAIAVELVQAISGGAAERVSVLSNADIKRLAKPSGSS